MPPGFVPAVPCVAPESPPPQPLAVSGIFAQPENPPMAWVEADFLQWWVRQGPVPPLVTTGPSTPPAGVFPGALGNAGTKVLFGNDIDFDSFSGVRLTAGMWFDYGRTIGFEASGFLFESKSVNFSAASDANGNPVLAQPFYDVTTNLEGAAFLSFPNAYAGNVSITATSRMGSAEGNFMTPLLPDADFRIEGLAGFRYFNLSEGLQMNSTVGIAADAGVGIPPAFQPPLAYLGTTRLAYPMQMNILDSFRTQSAFYGGQVGIRGRWAFLDRLYLKAQAEVALGAVQHSVDINGFTSLLSGPNGTVLASTPGGLYAVTSNIGHYSFTRFAALPSGEIKLGFELFPNVDVEVGYSGLYLTNVVRPGSFVEREVNPGQVPNFLSYGLTPTTPTTPFHLNTTTYWAEGISIGINISY